MAITNDIKSTVKLTADAVTDVTHSVIEKSRLKAKASRIKQVIKSDTIRREQAYMELGKYFYENHRELMTKELDEPCMIIDKTTIRIDKATKRYFEVLAESDSISLSSENTEKIKKIVCEKTDELKKNTGEKLSETKAKAKDLTGKTKEKAKDIAKKAKEKIDDFKAYVAPDEDEVFTDDDFDDFVVADDDDFEDFVVAESDEDFDNFIIVDDDFEDDSINLDYYKNEEVAEEVAEDVIEEIAEEIESTETTQEAPVIETPQVQEIAEVVAENTAQPSDDVAVVSVDDEESPDEFEF